MLFFPQTITKLHTERNRDHSYMPVPIWPISYYSIFSSIKESNRESERERDKSQQQSPPDALYFKVQILEY